MKWRKRIIQKIRNGENSKKMSNKGKRNEITKRNKVYRP